MAHDFQTRVEACRQATELLATGLPMRKAAARVGIPQGTLERWLRAWRHGGPDALASDYSGVGRKAVCEWTSEDVKAIREVYLRTNRGRGSGSMSHAVRRLVFEEKRASGRGPRKLSQKALAVLDRNMGSKQYIPNSLKKKLAISPQVFRHHRDPRNAALSGPYVPGGTRLSQDATRRLWAGERRSFDDGSQNQVVCVPWPYGGDRCSDKYGVRVQRGQWLVAHDDGSGFVTSWTFTLRPRDSYRASDALGQVYRDARDMGMPDEVVMEGGAWQGKQAMAFYRAAGLRVIDAKGRPHLKLIEGWWNRAWTHLSVYERGQIGRFRGEYKRENDLLMRCRAGSEDPRRHFPLLPDLLREFSECVDFLNQDPIESTIYGRWVPASRWEEDKSNRPRVELPRDTELLAAPESRVVTVRRGGMVLATVVCPLGISVPYAFAHEDLIRFEGAKVRVLFDPFEPAVRAAVVLNQNHLLAKSGALLCIAECLNPPPLPIASEGWELSRDPGSVQAAVAMKRALGNAVRTEYRSLGDGGRKGAVLSETRGPDGVMKVEAADGRLVRMETNLGDAAGTEPGGRSCALPSEQEGGIPSTSFRRKQLTESDLDRATAEAAALEARLLERGMLLPQ